MRWPPTYGNWEGGFTDSLGRRWHHVPHEGWEQLGPPHFIPKPLSTWQKIITWCQRRLARRRHR